MQTFRTELFLQPSPCAIGYSNRLLCVGSCFTEHIGSRLSEAKFRVLTNPFGIVYNPVSMAQSLERLMNRRVFGQADIFENAGLWHSWVHHGHFSKPTADETLQGINDALLAGADALQTADRLLITLGSATVYCLQTTGEIVANCHKMPSATFTKRRLSVAEITAALLPVLSKLKTQNADLQVVLTISPVRHLRDGFVENQRSKAALVLACEAIGAALPFVHYFPAYELLLDDLRDYRFYEADMVHPNGQAVQYIWERFGEAFFSASTQALRGRIEKLRAAFKHRPFNPSTPQHRAFLQAQLAVAQKLEEEYPWLDWGEEIKYFSV